MGESLTCAHREKMKKDNKIKAPLITARGKAGLGLFLITALIAACFLFADRKKDPPFVPGPPYAGPHTLLFLGCEESEKSPFAHPLLPAADEAEKKWDGYRILSVQEGDILKVVVYGADKEEFLPRKTYWHLYHPNGRDVSGLPARYLGESGAEGVKFADGTTLYAHRPPPDAVGIGTSEWPYQMRWQRLWQNYYVVAVYRGAARVICEWLVREKEGKDVSAVLGEYHGDPAHKAARMTAAELGNRISVYGFPEKDLLFAEGTQVDERRVVKSGRTITIHPEFYELIPVRREELPALPPDFPRHLVRGWQ